MAKYQPGIAAIFLTEEAILKAAEKTKAMGYQNFEVLSPYPVHGMEEACGIKRSWIPFVTFTMGMVGLTSGLLLTWWTSAVNWALNIGGKPFFSLPAFIPIMFELTILFAALSSVGALFYACGIPKINPPVIDPDLTCNKFCVFVPSSEKNFDEKKLEEFFRGLGADVVKKAEF